MHSGWNAPALRSGMLLCVGLTLLTTAGGCISRKVVVRSTPRAELYIDGKPRGKTPFTGRLTWKKHTVHRLELQADNYESQSWQLDRKAARDADDPWEFEVTLAPLVRDFTVRIVSEPAGATVRAGGRTVGQTPLTVPIRLTRRSSYAPWSTVEIEVAADEYAPQRRVLTYNDLRGSRGPYELRFVLARVVDTVPVEIRSDPPGARVIVAGRQVATTPARVPLRFSRSSAERAWSTATVRVELENYLPRTCVVTYEQAKRGLAPIRLVEVRREVPVSIVSNIEGADVYVDGAKIGTTPLRHTFVFTRLNDSSPWSTFLIRVAKEGYRWRRAGGPVEPGDIAPYVHTLKLSDAMKGELSVPLEKIRYYRTKLRYYEHGPKGITLVEEVVLSAVRTSETEPKVKSVSRLTDFKPGQLMRTRIWVTPDEDLVYAVPFSHSEFKEKLSNLWLRRRSGGQTRLTDELTIDIDAAVSLDGRYCYFAANRIEPNTFNLWRVPMDLQGGFTKITDSPSAITDTWASVSPDGRRIVYQSMMRNGDGRWQIWTANADGTLPTQLRVGKHPAWSPDGTKIAYVAPGIGGIGLQIWVMGADGSNPTQLTQGPRTHDFPVWTPDGKHIVYAADESFDQAEGVYNMDIWIMDVHGINRTRLTVNGSYDTCPAVCPRGRHIYFISNRGARAEYDDNWQIWSIEYEVSWPNQTPAASNPGQR
ncbi:MAG: PEGA domain-containing protein [Planctomycetota bacterium]|nr:MAG: PEGA domain-containing protein [Planctomycetota bacterium]